MSDRFDLVPSMGTARPSSSACQGIRGQGVKDGVQVNRLLPGPGTTGRKEFDPARWARAHDMTVGEASVKFPQEAGIERYGQLEEIVELMAFLVSPAARWMTGSAVRMDGNEVKSI